MSVNQVDSLFFVGVFRPRPDGPGFGIPIFKITEDSKNFYVQKTGNNDRIAGFTECSIEPSYLREISTLLVNKHLIGAPAIFAFEMNSGIMLTGNRDETKKSLQKIIPTLNKYPFTLSEVATFLNDVELKSKATMLCAKLLKETKELHKIFGELRRSPSPLLTTKIGKRLSAEARIAIRKPPVRKQTVIRGSLHGIPGVIINYFGNDDPLFDRLGVAKKTVLKYKSI